MHRFHLSAPLVVCAGLWLALVYQLGAHWSVYEQYHYGWAVPILCLCLLRRRGRSIPQSESASRVGPRFVALLLLALAALAYAPTRWLHEANPVWRLTTSLWAIEVATITLCTVYLQHGSGRLRAWAWPVGFFFLAIPWPSAWESFIAQRLGRLNGSVAVEILGLVGVPSLQHGNVIETAAGAVGIDEACSGLQSLQATLMLSVFLGEYYRLRTTWRLGCVLVGCLVSAFGNLGRTTLLAWVAAKGGLVSLDRWHDPAGIAILVAAFLALWFLARCLATATKPCDPIVSEPQFSGTLQVRSAGPDSPGRCLAVALALWFASSEICTQTWYHFHEAQFASSLEWSLKKEPEIPDFRQVGVSKEILVQFFADEAREGRWQDVSGMRGQVYYFRWRPARSLGDRVRAQLAKTHRPERCLPGLGMTLDCDLGVCRFRVGKLNLALRHYVFRAEGVPTHVFYGCYEDFTENEELAFGREHAGSRVAAALAGSRNSGQRWLEIALSCVPSAADAVAVLRDVLPRLIKVRDVGQGNGEALRVGGAD